MKKLKKAFWIVANCFVAITFGFVILKVFEIAFIVGVIKMYRKNKNELNCTTATPNNLDPKSACESV